MIYWIKNNIKRFYGVLFCPIGYIFASMIDAKRFKRVVFLSRALARIGNAYRKMDNLDECLRFLNKSLSEHRSPAVAKTVQEVRMYYFKERSGNI